MKYTYLDASKLYNDAFIYGLSGAELLASYDAVVRDCNGIGSDWMPSAMVKLCTKLNGIMEVPAAIHDRRYVTKGISRSEADLEFLTNTIRVIKWKYSWWNPIRYLMMRRAMRYYTYLLMFGEKAWEGAQRK